MNITPIRTKKDHAAATARITRLMFLDPAPGSPESDELEILAQIVENYEKQHYDLGHPDPIDLILFAMEQRELSKKDMIPLLGSASRVSEVLGRKRPLTLPMIRNLHHGLKLPLEVLILGTTSAELSQGIRVQKPVPIRSLKARKRAASPKKLPV